MHIITWKAMHVIVCFHSIWTTAKIVTPNFNLFYFNQACGFFVTIVSGEILSHPACSKVNINTADSRVFVNKSTIYVMQGLSMLTLWSLQIKRHGYRSVCVKERQQDDAINSQGTVLIFFSKPWILSMYCYLLYSVH